MRVKLKHRRLAEELSKSRSSLNRWALRLGLSSGHLSDLVNGKRIYPAPETREKLLNGLELPFESLFEIEDGRDRPVTVPASLRDSGFYDAATDRPRRQRRRKGRLMIGGWIRDIRVAARGLWRSKGFTLAALATLTVGIGSNVALFSIVDSILWKPYPYPEAERLVVVHGIVERRGVARSNLSFPDAVDLKEQSDLLDGLAAWDWEPYNLTVGEEAERVGGTRVMAGFFQVLGVGPLMGRTFTPSDDQPGAEPVVVLSAGLWKTSFGADPNVVGRVVSINAHPTTVIGVMPRAAEYPDQTELWVPLRFDEESAPRGVNFLGTVGRLKPNVTLGALDTELGGIGARLEQGFPETNEGRSFGAITLREALTDDIATMSVSILGGVTFVLLIVCANVANLLLSRGIGRERELAIRRAVGASGGRLAQALLCESWLLALLGGVAGFGLSLLVVDQVLRLVNVPIPPWIQTEVDVRVVLYTALVTGLAASIFSLFPMLQALRQSLSRSLQEGGPQRGTSLRGRRFRATLVMAEVALSLILLVGAGLMLKSVVALSSVRTGFEPRGAMVVGLDLLAKGAERPRERSSTFERFLSRFEAIPGVDAVGAVSTFPLRRRSNSVRVLAEGQDPSEAEENPLPQVARVTPDYFRALGIPTLRGDASVFSKDSEADVDAVVSEGLAQALWPDQDAIGRRLTLWGSGSEFQWLTVRGIVGDIVHHGLDRARPAHLYLSYRASAPTRMTVVLRARDESQLTALPASVRAAVRAIDPNQPIHDVSTVQTVVDRSMWQWRFFGTLFWWFGGLALVLALVGIYGVMSYTVSQRGRELGLRMALGASTRDVLSMVLREGGLLILAGIALGFPASVALGSFLSSVLFRVQPVEPLTLAAVSLLLIAVSLTAVLLPARRAAHVDPASSLRVG